MTLKNEIIRLAYEKPELRKHLLPLVTASSFEEAVKGKKFKHPQTRNDVVFNSLPTDEQKKIREKWEKGDKGKGNDARKTWSKPQEAFYKSVDLKEEDVWKSLPKDAHKKIKEVAESGKASTMKIHGIDFKIIRNPKDKDTIVLESQTLRDGLGNLGMSEKEVELWYGVDLTLSEKVYNPEGHKKKEDGVKSKEKARQDARKNWSKPQESFFKNLLIDQYDREQEDVWKSLPKDAQKKVKEVLESGKSVNMKIHGVDFHLEEAGDGDVRLKSKASEEAFRDLGLNEKEIKELKDIRFLLDVPTLTKSKTAADTFKCPTCDTKVLEQTSYCVKCKKKVKKAASSTFDVNYRRLS